MSRSSITLGLTALAFVAPLSAAPTTQPVSRPMQNARAGALTIADCHDAAAAHLAKVCEDYRRLKAMELSRLRDIPFEQAYTNIQSVMPVLRPINRPLLVNRITNPEDVPPHKREVELVESEVATMVALAERLTREMQASPPPPPPPPTVVLAHTSQAVQNTAESQSAGTDGAAVQAAALEVEKLARENSGARAIDLSGAMRAAMGASPENSRHELPGSARGAAEQEIEKANFKDRDWGFGRRLTSDGEPMEWMFIDTWYTIGPFPNPKRVNINTKFPPETVVDLSATYPGKDGRETAWEFLQTNRAQCAPNRSEQYAIYYAYTELWFEEDTDLWIVVGSDDKSNLWINNLPVWISGEELKKWRINEGFRKVYFKKGLNKILYRVENGWSNTYFSLGIQVRPR